MWVGCAVLALALAGCKRRASTDLFFDGGAAASQAPANADDVTRYPNEKKLDAVPAVVLRDSADVRKSPPNGPILSTLPKGTTVSEIAQSGSSFVVTFDDPTSGKRLMGWINDDAFTPGPPVGATVATGVAPPRASASARRDGGAQLAALLADAGSPVATDAGARAARGAPSSSAGPSFGARR
jgi:hypothetical protein